MSQILKAVDFSNNSLSTVKPLIALCKESKSIKKIRIKGNEYIHISDIKELLTYLKEDHQLEELDCTKIRVKQEL